MTLAKVYRLADRRTQTAVTLGVCMSCSAKTRGWSQSMVGVKDVVCPACKQPDVEIFAAEEEKTV